MAAQCPSCATHGGTSDDCLIPPSPPPGKTKRRRHVATRILPGTPRTSCGAPGRVVVSLAHRYRRILTTADMAEVTFPRLAQIGFPARPPAIEQPPDDVLAEIFNEVAGDTPFEDGGGTIADAT